MPEPVARIEPPPITFTPEQQGDRELFGKVIVVLSVCYEQLENLGIVFDNDPLATIKEQDFRPTG